MHNRISKHNIKKSTFLLAATLILISCCTLVSAKTVKIRGTLGSVKNHYDEEVITAIPTVKGVH